MSAFFDDAQVQLVRGPNQRPVASVAEGLAGKKYVLLVFCARHIPASRPFTPSLREFYDKFALEKNFEVIFVSLDKSKAAQSAYMESMHGEWLAMTYESAKTVGDQLVQQYGIELPPAVLVFENTSEGRRLITKVGREMMMHDEDAEKFPWPNGEADLRRYKRGLLINILICINIALLVGFALMRYTS